MNEQKRAWIYGRISNYDNYELLSYQIDLLTQYAHENNYAIVGSTRAFDSRESFKSTFVQYLINSIVSEFMDCILFYSTNQLLIDSDKLEELGPICKMHIVLSSRSSNDK